MRGQGIREGWVQEKDDAEEDRVLEKDGYRRRIVHERIGYQRRMGTGDGWCMRGQGIREGWLQEKDGAEEDRVLEKERNRRRIVKKKDCYCQADFQKGSGLKPSFYNIKQQKLLCMHIVYCINLTPVLLRVLAFKDYCPGFCR